MPPHIQPRSLQDLSIVRVAGMVFHSCFAIETLAKQQTARDSLVYMQEKVGELQQFLFDYVPHQYFNEVCEVMCEIYAFKYRPSFSRSLKWSDFVNNSTCPHRVVDARIFSLLLIHDRVKELKFGQAHYNSLDLALVQIQKLQNLIELDVFYVKLTDQVLVEIGRTCVNLKKVSISLNSTHSSLESLNNLLKCTKLELVEIGFFGWPEHQYSPYLTKLVAELPKIKMLNNRSSKSSAYLFNLTSVTSLQRLDLMFPRVTVKDVTKLFPLCPQAKFLSYRAPINKTDQEILLSGLAKSSLEIQYFRFFSISAGKELCRFLDVKGCNVTELSLLDCEVLDITLNDMVYTIGRNCPQLEVLVMSGTWEDEPPTAVSVPQMLNISLVQIMFCNLIELKFDTWLSDLRLLLQILKQTTKLICLSVAADGGMYNTGSQDILSQILNTNALNKLVTLELRVHNWNGQYITLPSSRSTMERLLESCPMLTSLKVYVPLDDDALLYIEELKIRIKSENLDLKLMCWHLSA